MGGLNTSLSIGVEALNAAQASIDTTSNNISNANTAGYTEEVAQLGEDPIYVSDGEVSGGGVNLEGIQSVQNQLLNVQIQQQTSSQNAVSTESTLLQQIQTYFSSTGTDIASALTTFSSNLTALSAAPTNAGTQQAVLSGGQDLAQAFNTTAEGLTSAQSSADSQVTTSVAQINTLTQQIAQLNGQVARLTGTGQSDGSVEDQLNAAELQLAGVVGISITQTSEGDTVTTANGTPLVIGDQSYGLQTTAGSNGSQEVLDSSGNDITSSIQGGQLGGAIQMRDQVIPEMLSQLNSLATQVISSFNTAQSEGVDSNGNAGQDFFSVPINSNAAAGMTVAISSGAQIAINSGGAASASNVANLFGAISDDLPSSSSISSSGSPTLPLSLTTALTSGSVTSILDAGTGQTYKFTAGTSSTLADLQAGIANAVAAGTLSPGTSLSIDANGHALISTTTAGDTLQVSTNDAVLGDFASTGQTPATSYASLVFNVGNATSNASTQSTAIGKTLLQLTDQLGASSGVNIDDETANLIRFQTAYEAAARIVSTIQQLNTVVMDMGSTQSY